MPLPSCSLCPALPCLARPCFSNALLCPPRQRREGSAGLRKLHGPARQSQQRPAKRKQGLAPPSTPPWARLGVFGFLPRCRRPRGGSCRSRRWRGRAGPSGFWSCAAPLWHRISAGRGRWEGGRPGGRGRGVCHFVPTRPASPHPPNRAPPSETAGLGKALQGLARPPPGQPGTSGSPVHVADGPRDDGAKLDRPLRDALRHLEEAVGRGLHGSSVPRRAGHRSLKPRREGYGSRRVRMTKNGDPETNTFGRLMEDKWKTTGRREGTEWRTISNRTLSATALPDLISDRQ